MRVNSADDVATAAVLSLLLEVSANPKSGNVDRLHQYHDIRYEHFILSSVSVYPIFKKAASKGGSIGKYIYDAVKKSIDWGFHGNTHFGSFVLLIPLILSWKEKDTNAIANKATELIKKSSYIDSIYFLKAFKLVNPRVLECKEFSLESENIERLILESKINLYKWMLLAPSHNLIAKELTSGYKISLEGKDLILDFFVEKEDLNEAIVLTYHTLLSKYTDPLLISKFGYDFAKDVQKRVKKALTEYERGVTSTLTELDQELINIGANPGTIADIVSSSIFLAVMEGLKF